MSISSPINENIKEIVLLTQEIANIYEDSVNEASFISRISNEISELDGYVNSTYDKLNHLINDIKSVENSYLKELENRENVCSNSHSDILNHGMDGSKQNVAVALKCEEFEKELSDIHNRYALLLEKKKNLLKSMRDSEDVLCAKKKMYQSISMISWSLISESFIQGHFIPVNSPTKTETFQLKIDEKSKVKNAEYLWSEIEKF
ncbi:hypothetical protein OIY81_1300 [Cryptosporidium canis]|uniref:Kinetochore protein Spc24 n=1 Tax=Cryptosporidium canis TaxID=195482 RepID=A0ABQ8P6M3_9CRYT|nr:hypothetical protein OJ252_1966 [Cryptosporidium canis]KAJ1612482.1 hypothetical protein OIY81_1300 [Cryptosporidium canis]